MSLKAHSQVQVAIAAALVFLIVPGSHSVPENAVRVWSTNVITER